MKLATIYPTYFQKSKIFLYPLLEIKIGAVLKPIEVYFEFENKFLAADRFLLCRFENKTDIESKKFENEVLMNHKRFRGFIVLKDYTKLFLFDFNDLASDYDFIFKGEYSKVSKNIKYKILNHFDKNGSNYMYMETFLFPEKFYDKYAELLDVEKGILMQTTELCDKPDLVREKITNHNLTI